MARKIFEQKQTTTRRREEEMPDEMPGEVNEVTAKVGDLALAMLLEIDNVLGDGPDGEPDEIPPESGSPEAA